MVQKLDLSILNEYIDYLKSVRCFDDAQIRLLCYPIQKLLNAGMDTEQILSLSYVEIYEKLYNRRYKTRQTTAKKVRRAINHYQCYLQQKGDDEE